MPQQIGGAQMRDLGNIIKERIPGLGFALIVFPFDGTQFANYISNAQRDDMINALRATADRLEFNRDFNTPETN